MTKMVVCDMDGTLLRSDYSISDYTKRVLDDIKKQGIQLVLATGRPDQLMKEYVDELGIDTPIIMYNGSVIGHPLQEKNLYEASLDNDVCKDVIQYCDQHDLTYMVYTKQAIISTPNDRVRFFQERNESLPVRLQAQFVEPQDINGIIHDPIFKILLIEQDQDKHAALYDHFSTYDHVHITASQSTFIDINPLGTSKGSALTYLAKHLNIPLTDIVVFGDQDNDKTMLEVAGTSIAMENAIDSLKEIADDITLSNNEDGVAVWLEKHILNHKKNK